MPLEVSDADVQRLADGLLRELIERLCRAELCRAGLPLSAVKAGGHQSAGDAGIDVHVDLAGAPEGLDFISRGRSGLQAKAQAMPASRIAAEMLVQGRLKPAIHELIEQGGAYLLVSSKDSCTHKMLRERLAVMGRLAAEAGLPGAALDFIGADRLAAWVNQHPGVSLWLRERLDGAYQGWRGHGAWAAGAVDVGLLVDERHACVEAPGARMLTTPQALEEIRALLRRPGEVVRLAGLCGTGKTRLAQALFEDSWGDDPLPSLLAVYCDLAEAPLQPAVVDMTRRLAARGGRQVLVVDNCDPLVHRALSTALHQAPGGLSMLTVAHDVLDGEAEDTAVYQLSSASARLLHALLWYHWRVLGRLVRDQIAEASQGNARVAMALASAASRGGSVSGLPSAELFRRLFWQRTTHDPELQHVARVLALVHSFDATEPGDAGDDSEWGRLAQLAEMSPQRLSRYLGVLVTRRLVERRGRWCAVVPQALAHHLAGEGLRGISEVQVARHLLSHARLATALARRLSPLHASTDAQRLVEQWFARCPDLTLFSGQSLPSCEIFCRLAPVRPDLALARLEALTAQKGAGLLGEHRMSSRSAARKVALQLAYPAEQFARAAEVYVQLLLPDDDDDFPTSDDKGLHALFRVERSATSAPLETRLAVLAAWLDSRQPRQHLAMRALAEALKVDWWSDYATPFGAHVRDRGWQPQSPAERRDWYGCVLAFIAGRAALCPDQAASLAEVVACALPKLLQIDLIDAPLEDLLNSQFAQEHSQLLWQGLAVAAVHEWDREHRTGSHGAAALARRLERALWPTTLKARLEALVVVAPGGPLDVLTAERRERRLNGIEPIGEYEDLLIDAAVAMAGCLDAPGLIEHWTIRRPGHAALLGSYTAMACDDLREGWALLQTRFAAMDSEQRSSDFLQGFFHVLRRIDDELADDVLDGLLGEPVLMELCLELQASQPLTKKDVERLLVVAASGAVPVARFDLLRSGAALNGIAPSNCRRLLRAIAALPMGVGWPSISMQRWSKTASFRTTSLANSPWTCCSRSTTASKTVRNGPGSRRRPSRRLKAAKRDGWPSAWGEPWWAVFPSDGCRATRRPGWCSGFSRRSRASRWTSSSGPTTCSPLIDGITTRTGTPSATLRKRCCLRGLMRIPPRVIFCWPGTSLRCRRRPRASLRSRGRCWSGRLIGWPCWRCSGGAATRSNVPRPTITWER